MDYAKLDQVERIQKENHCAELIEKSIEANFKPPLRSPGYEWLDEVATLYDYCGHWGLKALPEHYQWCMDMFQANKPKSGTKGLIRLLELRMEREGFWSCKVPGEILIKYSPKAVIDLPLDQKLKVPDEITWRGLRHLVVTGQLVDGDIPEQCLKVREMFSGTIVGFDE